MLNNFKKYIDKHQVDVDLLEVQEFNPHLIVVIPCYDEPDLDKTLESLQRCRRNGFVVEIIVIINSGENASVEVIEQNRRTYVLLSNLVGTDDFRVNSILLENIKRKYAGVGYARKVGMDLAVARFYQNNNEKGIIVSLDADTLVVENYLESIYLSLSQNKNVNGALIRFEHPVSGGDFPQEIYNAIANYELHMRYQIQALKYAGFPYSKHTFGSAFAVKSSAYVRYGGMNRRQGGEDFYFLHKLFPHGKFLELNETCVYPSPRISDRAPFGTGQQVRQCLSAKNLTTYNLEVYIELKAFFENIPQFITSRPLFSDVLESFFAEIDFDSKLIEIRNNTNTEASFAKRFFVFFDAFKVLQFLNFAHTHHFKKNDVLTESSKLLTLMGEGSCDNVFDQLGLYRKIEGK